MALFTTWLDSNSWLWEIDGIKILVDPWLVDTLVFGNAPWLFEGKRPEPIPVPESVDLILLSQGLPDHAHRPTLEILDKSIPVFGSVAAAEVAQEIGFTNVTTINHGDRVEFQGGLFITAFPGAVVGPFTKENGYVVEAKSGVSLYYEPHGYPDPALKELGSIDVAITPIVDLELPLSLPVLRGHAGALELAQMVTPRLMLPTAGSAELEFGGVLTKLLQEKGSAEQTQADLKQAGLATRVMVAAPGDRLDLSTATAAAVE
ncbi:MAG: MBL fold metallo-hydrolase [Cyanobacteria bacterium P01_D01_bin.128]